MWIAVLIIIILIIAALAAVVYHDTHSFKVWEYEITTDKVKGQYSFVFLTDLHNYVFGRDNEKLVSKIAEISPDAILCGGDMFTARPRNGVLHTQTAFSLLSKLSKLCPVYATSGNHEENIRECTREFGNAFERYKSSLEREGIIYLENKSVSFSDDIRITGLALDLTYFRKVRKKEMEPGLLNSKLGEIKGSEKDRFQILMAHNPVYFQNYEEWGADLTVSGHVHGGIIRLPLIGGIISPALVLFPKYDGGKYNRNGRSMVLSRGLGTHTINVRMFNPGEVSLIRVKGTKDVT